MLHLHHNTADTPPPFLYPQQCVPLSPMELDDYIQVHRRAIERVLGHHIWSLTFRFRSLFETANNGTHWEPRDGGGERYHIVGMLPIIITFQS